mmetsp:Transcript_19195/g.56883  ORF Transcript_19195/g.56883 Transcript_19195/m.56883 type:complete len:80 (+) Transcript_19195:237-476(+)
MGSGSLASSARELSSATGSATARLLALLCYWLSLRALLLLGSATGPNPIDEPARAAWPAPISARCAASCGSARVCAGRC